MMNIEHVLCMSHAFTHSHEGRKSGVHARGKENEDRRIVTWETHLHGIYVTYSVCPLSDVVELYILFHRSDLIENDPANM